MRKVAPPFWIEGVDETCSHCGHPHSHGAGVRCDACDQTVCLLCFELEGGDVLCVPCKPPKKTKRGARA